MNEASAPDIASVAAVAGGGRVATFLGRIALALIVAMWVAPLYWLVNTAFKIKVQIQSPTPIWFPNPITLDNLQWVYENLDPSAFERSLRVVGISVGIAIILGPIMAYALSRFRGRWNAQVENWIISTRMTPPAALIMPFYFLALRAHLLNSEIGLVILYVAINLPLTVWMMLAFLRSIPVDAEEAAYIDGCGPWSAFFRIVMPMMRASIISGALLVLILTWNEFFVAFILMSSNITFPVQVGSFLAVGLNPEYGHMAAAGLLLSLPPILIAIIFRKSLLTGVHAFAGGK